jgi:hypothetical protein
MKFRGTCYHNTDLDVQLTQTGIDRFTVRYGKQVKTALTYSQAAAELGACIMHSLACNEKLDNREKGER